MARQYSPTQFFRCVPNALLARYFQEKHGVLREIDFGKLRESDADTIFQAFMESPDDKQAEIEAECQDIDVMACQGGATALADEADFHGDTDFPEGLAKIDGFHGKAMVHLPVKGMRATCGGPLWRRYLRLSELLPIGLSKPEGTGS